MHCNHFDPKVANPQTTICLFIECFRFLFKSIESLQSWICEQKLQFSTCTVFVFMNVQQFRLKSGNGSKTILGLKFVLNSWRRKNNKKVEKGRNSEKFLHPFGRSSSSQEEGVHLINFWSETCHQGSKTYQYQFFFYQFLEKLYQTLHFYTKSLKIDAVPYTNIWKIDTLLVGTSSYTKYM